MWLITRQRTRYGSRVFCRPYGTSTRYGIAVGLCDDERRKPPSALNRFILLPSHNHVSNLQRLFGRPFVKRFALCYRSVVCLSVCLSCLSVRLVYCGQTVGWISMPLGIEVGLGPGDIVLDEDPAPPNGHTPVFDPCLLCPNGWVNQEWHFVRRLTSAQAILC